jgi:hypothetical protein
MSSYHFQGSPGAAVVVSLLHGLFTLLGRQQDRMPQATPADYHASSRDGRLATHELLLKDDSLMWQHGI